MKDAKSQMNNKLALQVLIGAILGAIIGVCFSNYANFFEPIGSIYVMLLQAVVYPYIFASLLHGLGALAPDVASKLFKRGWLFYLLVIILTFLVIYALAQTIPSNPSSIISNSSTNVTLMSFIERLIPNNVFEALAHNYMPAVVVFCLLFGIALQHAAEKTAFLEILIAIKTASIKIWQWVISLSPIGVFALVAYSAGTIQFSGLTGVVIYFVLFFFGAFALTFWILPAIICSFTSLSYFEILKKTRSALVIGVTTSLSVAALPLIEQMTRKIVEELSIKDESSDDIVATNTTVSYPLSQLGNYFLLLFILFAAFYFQYNIASIDKIYLPILTYFAGIGSPSTAVSGVSFLSNWVRLPSNASVLYVELSSITRYLQVLVSVMGIATVTILVTLAYYRKITVRMKPLVINFILIIFIFVFGIIFISNKNFLSTFVKHNSLLTFSLSPDLTKGVSVQMLNPPDYKQPISPLNPALTLYNIQKTHAIRVGYNPNMIPFCYFNDNGQLVGYDVAYMYKLAKDLNAKLIFIPFDWYNLVSDIKQNKFDIAIGSIYVTPTRLFDISFTNNYLIDKPSFIVVKNKANAFRDLKGILN